MRYNLSMKKIRIFKRYDCVWEIVFAAVTVIALFVAAFALLTFTEPRDQIIALFCVFVVCVIVFAVLNLFHGLPAAIACFVAAEIMCSSLLLNALSPLFVSALADGTLYDSPTVEREIFKDKNVMIFVPHQDDELNIMAGVVEQYLAAGSSVKIVYMTFGDYYGISETRIKETMDIAEFYGIDPSDLIFFGYGDQWQGTHIYNASGDEVVTSHCGNTATYTVGDLSPYKSESYTRNNLLNDFESVILEYLPDTIFAVDYDHHPDHRANSLFVDEALAHIFKTTDGYNPVVYKAFAYSTAWEAPKDFYDGDNIPSTVDSGGAGYMTEVNCYNWADRVRFPMANGSLGYLMEGTSVYKAYCLPVSQQSYGQAIRVINSDKVFFRRDTTSLLYKAEITVSSNKDDAFKLNDFKLFDSEDISVEYGNDFYAGTWSPSSSDNSKEITVKFSSPQTLSLIRLYDSVSLDDNVLKATVTLSDGTTIIAENISKNGAASDITFDKKNNISGFTVKIDEYEGSEYGFSEIEAYSEAPDYYDDGFIKIEDLNGDFAYEYTVSSKTEYFRLYGYERSSDVSDYEVTCDGNITASIEDGKIKVVCGLGAEGILTVKSKDGAVYDSVKITNPNVFVRMWRGFWKQAEHYYSFNLRSRYYQTVYNFAMSKLK